MVNKSLSIIIIVISVFLISFAIWHFFISIYEVKYSSNFKSTTLLTNSKYSIKCSGINSLSWELNWRNVNPKIEILEGEDLVIIKNIRDNEFQILTKAKKGNLKIEISSPFAFNSSQYLLYIKNSN